MPQFTLQINMNNDAFADYPITELVECVKEVAENIELSNSLNQHGNIKDINGNTIGKWEITN